MRTMKRCVLILLAGCTPASTREPAPAQSGAPRTVATDTDATDTVVLAHGRRTVPLIDTVLIRIHTRVLAHDSLAGRGTGTAESLAAALYIARQLDSLGARPLVGAASRSPSPSPYLHPVPLQRSDLSAATIRLDGWAPDSVWRHGHDYLVGRLGRAGLRAAAGPVARLGSDSTRVSAGRWLLLDAPPGEAAVRWLPAWRRAGISGIIVRLPSDAAFAAWRDQLGDVRWQLLEGEPDPVWQPALPILMVSPELANRLAGSEAVLEFEPNASMDTTIGYNVAGYVAGSDPARARQSVYLTAHYDHLGVARGNALRDSIYNGFSDNAAGVAMLLAIAAGAVEAPPARPLVFLFPTAEEVGLLGTIHFVRTHAVDTLRVRAIVNVDAGAPPAPPTRWRLAAASRSRALGIAAAVVASHGWTQRSDPGSPNSDHWPFVQSGIPAVFLIPDGGYEDVSDEEATRLRARWDHYHQTSDEWAPDFPFSGLARYAALAGDIARAFANEPADVR